MNLFKSLFRRSDGLKKVIEKGALLVDVRSPGEFAQGSVPGAVNIPLDGIRSQLTRFKGKENIVLFCQSGMRSRQAKSVLEQNGFTNVTNGGSWLRVMKLVK